MEQSFRFVEGWGGGPEGRTLGIASGVAVDSRDRVYVIDREPDPAIVVYDREGELITTWGEDIFSVPHELWIDEHDRVLVADCGDHTVRICTADGQVLQTLGTPGVPGAAGMPFNRPTRAVVAPDGEIWVADGYGQECLHRFSAAGELLATFGGRGAGPGRFTLPHSVVCDDRGHVWSPIASRTTGSASWTIRGARWPSGATSAVRAACSWAATAPSTWPTARW